MSTASKGKERARSERRPAPAFEMVVLGCGGGPLETDCSGYLVKAAKRRWEDGLLALEGGSGLGALATLLEYRDAKTMFTDLIFPPTHTTAVLRAAYVFSFLKCYLITHAHLDHTLSLIMLTGSVPPRSSHAQHPQPPLSSPPASMAPTSRAPTSGPSAPRPPVYGTKETLLKLAGAYGGGLWPELGSWAPKGTEGDTGLEKNKGTRGKRRRVDGPADEGKGGPSKKEGSGVVFSPLAPSNVHRPLNPSLPITTLTFPVAHGCTSHGLYESSAIFIRYDPAALTEPQKLGEHSEPEQNEHDEGKEGWHEQPLREFLFFGDVESSWRKESDKSVNADIGKTAKELNRAIWEEAAKSWNEGRLAGIFIECSYDSSRPTNLMFGHVSPPGLYHELSTLSSLVVAEKKPLDGLRVFITHIKEALIPHPSGKTAREIIMSELRALEDERPLGVEFVEVKKGDRICE